MNKLVALAFSLVVISISCNPPDEFSYYSYEYQPFPITGVRYEFDYAINFYDPSDTVIRSTGLSHDYSIYIPSRTDKSDYIFWSTELDGELIQNDFIYLIFGYPDIHIQAIPGETFIRLDLIPTTGMKYALFFDQTIYDPSRFFLYEFPFTNYDGKRVRNFFRAIE